MYTPFLHGLLNYSSGRSNLTYVSTSKGDVLRFARLIERLSKRAQIRIPCEFWGKNSPSAGQPAKLMPSKDKYEFYAPSSLPWRRSLDRPPAANTTYLQPEAGLLSTARTANCLLAIAVRLRSDGSRSPKPTGRKTYGGPLPQEKKPSDRVDYVSRVRINICIWQVSINKGEIT